MPFKKKKKVYPTARRYNSTDIVYGAILEHYANPECRETRLTYRLLAKKLRWRSVNSAFYHVKKLVERGKVVVTDGLIRLPDSNEH